MAFCRLATCAFFSSPSSTCQRGPRLHASQASADACRVVPQPRNLVHARLPMPVPKRLLLGYILNHLKQAGLWLHLNEFRCSISHVHNTYTVVNNTQRQTLPGIERNTKCCAACRFCTEKSRCGCRSRTRPGSPRSSKPRPGAWRNIQYRGEGQSTQHGAIFFQTGCHHTYILVKQQIMPVVLNRTVFCSTMLAGFKI